MIVIDLTEYLWSTLSTLINTNQSCSQFFTFHSRNHKKYIYSMPGIILKGGKLKTGVCVCPYWLLSVSSGVNLVDPNPPPVNLGNNIG